MIEDVQKARQEEVDYMIKRNIRKVVPKEGRWEKTGRTTLG